jgi:hypothetical protein
VPDGRTIVRGVNENAAWDTTPDGKVTARSPDAAVEVREIDADFDGLLVDYAKKGHTVAYAGADRTGGIDTHTLTVTLKSGAVRTVYLDATTFLRAQAARHDDDAAGPEGAGDADLQRLPDVDGIELPFAIDEERESFPVQTIAIYTEKIELNVPVEEAAFTPPAAAETKP